MAALEQALKFALKRVDTPCQSKVLHNNVKQVKNNGQLLLFFSNKPIHRTGENALKSFTFICVYWGNLLS